MNVPGSAKRLVRRLVRVLVGLLVLIGVLAGAAPFIRADGLRPAIGAALERSLGRKVELGSVRFTVLTGLGFSVSDVLIDEDAEAGIEPFAYVSQLHARVGLWALLTGRLEFTTLRLIEPSVNLVKPDNAGWNIVPLLGRTASAGGGDATRFPDIEVSGGRLNFKFGDRKSAFYLANADVDVARRDERTFEIRFSGEPSRTDKAAQGFGRVAGKGRWLRPEKGENTLDLDVELEKSALDDLVKLMRGTSAGLVGWARAEAHISGPVSNLEIRGIVRPEDTQRWNLKLWRTPGEKLEFRGHVDARVQRISLEATERENPRLPLALRVEVQEFLRQPKWGMTVRILDLPAASAVELGKRLGLLPQEVKAEGTLTGVIGAGTTGGIQGQVALTKAVVEMPRVMPMRLEKAELLIDGNQVRLHPATVTTDNGTELELEGKYGLAGGATSVEVRAKSLQMSELQPGSGQLWSLLAVPLGNYFARGVWSGRLRYEAEARQPGVWSGELDVRDAVVNVAGVAEPVRLRAAHLSISDSQLALHRMRGGAGKLDWTGDYTIELTGEQTHRFQLAVPLLDLQELERLLRPSLNWEPGGLVQRLRFRKPALPKWMESRRVQGRLTAAAVKAGDARMEKLRARLQWDQGRVQVPSIEALLENGVVKASGALDLRGGQADYSLDGQVSGMSWSGGQVELAGKWKTKGTGLDVLLNLQGEGTFQAKGLMPAGSVEVVRSASGAFEFAAGRSGARIRLSGVQAVMGAESFNGQGGSGSDGKVTIDLAGAGRSVRMVGTLAPAKIEIASGAGQPPKP